MKLRLLQRYYCWTLQKRPCLCTIPKCRVEKPQTKHLNFQIFTIRSIVYVSWVYSVIGISYQIVIDIPNDSLVEFLSKQNNLKIKVPMVKTEEYLLPSQTSVAFNRIYLLLFCEKLQSSKLLRYYCVQAQIKMSQMLIYSDAYLGPCQTNTYDGAFLRKKSNSQKPITSFTKKLHRRCLTGSLIHLWMKFFIKDFCNKYDQICRKLRIWSHLLKEYLMGNCMFRAESDSSHSMIIWQVIWLYLNSCLIYVNNIWCWRKVIASYTTKFSMSRVNRVINSLYGRFLCNGSAGCMSFSILQYVL